MQARPQVLLGLALAALGVAGSCELGTSKACTARGCVDQFRASISSADGNVPQGAHAVEVMADGVRSSCTFQVPLDQVPGGGMATPSCPSDLWVLIVQEHDCTESTQGNAKVLTCTPIPGRYTEEITVMGRPESVRVRVTVDGAVVLDRTESPSYEESRPNGPGCDPLCHQASVKWTFGAP
jgi:hypothetical protein